MTVGLWSIAEGDWLPADAFIDYGFSIEDSNILTANEILQPHQRGLVLRNIDPSAEYSFFVSAFRKVDANVNPLGVLRSSEAIAASSPYTPALNTAFTGNIEDTLTGPDPSATVRIYADLTAATQSSLIMPPDVTIEQDYTGAPLAGQYPLTFTIMRRKGSLDVSSSSGFGFGNRTGNLTDTNFSITGNVVTVLTGGIGTFTIVSTRTSEATLISPSPVTIKAHVNPPPAPTSTSTFTDVTTTLTDTVVIAVLSKAAVSNQVACTAASLIFAVGSSGSWGSSGLKMKWQWSTDGISGWTDINSFVADTNDETPAVPPDPKDGGGSDGGPGAITCNQTKTGLTNGTVYYFRLIAQSTFAPTPGYPIHITGTASLS